MKNVYFSVQNFHGGRPLRREVDTVAAAHALAKETPDSVVSALREGWLIRDWHFSAKHEIPSLGRFEEMVRAGVRSFDKRTSNPAGRIPASVRNLALKHRVSLARDEHGNYLIKENGKVVAHTASAKPTATNATALIRRYLRQKGSPVRNNPAHEVTELVLYAENTGPGSQGHERALWNQRESIIANLKRKVKKGVYDPALAAKLWTYWADSAAKAYNQIHGTGTYSLKGSPFSAADRREAGKIFEASFREQVTEDVMSNPRRKRPRSAAQKAATAKMLAANRARRGQLRAFSKVVGHPALSSLAAEGARKLRAVRKARGRKLNPSKWYQIFRFNSKTNDIYFLTLTTGGQYRWTLTRGDTLRWEDRAEGKSMAKHIAQKYPGEKVGLVTLDMDFPTLYRKLGSKLGKA